MKIMVSACLLGARCRYDGKSKPCEKITVLLKDHTLTAICPEVMGGLKTPRDPCEISENKVLNASGEDKTFEYRKGAEKALEIFKENGCELALLKSKSPSCGKGTIYDGSFTKTLKAGNGITAELFIKNGIRVITEEEIDQVL